MKKGTALIVVLVGAYIVWTYMNRQAVASQGKTGGTVSSKILGTGPDLGDYPSDSNVF